MASSSKDDSENRLSEPVVPLNVRIPDFRLNATLERCLKRVGHWPPPLNWSAADWSHEIRAHAICTVCQAESDYDPSRGVPFDAFVYQRMLTTTLTHYRQEWTYAHRYTPAGENIPSDETHDFDGAVGASEQTPFCYEELHCALASLPDLNCVIIYETFWRERTETDLAKAIGISQPAVNKRKHLALGMLREMLRESEKKCRPRL